MGCLKSQRQRLAAVFAAFRAYAFGESLEKPKSSYTEYAQAMILVYAQGWVFKYYLRNRFAHQRPTNKITGVDD